MTEALRRNEVGIREMSIKVRIFPLMALVFAMFPAITAGQANVVLNPAYRRAQAMVNEGNAVAGRALVDSMVTAASPGTNEYAEAVFWRAVLAATAAEAEMDYRRIVVDYTSSPRVEDALIRLAQLELSRANHDGALRHLNRLVTEHPNGASRPRAGYWMARALFDKNDIPGACAANADALARTSENDAELRNQITYLNQRCAGLSLATALSQSGTTGQPSPLDSSVSPVATAGTPVGTVGTGTTRPVTTPSVATPRVTTPPPAPQRVPDSAATDRAATPAPIEPASTGGAQFTVQIAAYNVKSQAEAMVARLKKRGYQARVSGNSAPFRVRIGRYATQAQATAVQRSLKAKQITGFVVQAEAR